MKTRVLVVGGTGVFGRRLVEGLCEHTTATIVVITRHGARAKKLFEAFGDRVQVAQGDVEALQPYLLKEWNIFAIINVFGPFREASPRLAACAIKAGVAYMDFADDREYVKQFSALDQLAKDHKVVVRTGVSTTCALSVAVVRQLVPTLEGLSHIEASMMLGDRLPKSPQILQAVLHWAGQPMQVFQEGRWQKAYGWSALKKASFLGFGRRWVALTHAPDLDVLYDHFLVEQRAVFYTSLEHPVWMWGLWGLTWMVRSHLQLQLTSWMPFLQKAQKVWVRGTLSSGFHVRVQGQDAIGGVEREWVLKGDQGLGQYIPVLPAIALLNKWLAGEMGAYGAAPCVHDISWKEIAPYATSFGLVVEEHTQYLPKSSLFQDLLPTTFDQLSPAVQAWHTPKGGHVWEGEGEVWRGSSWYAKLLGRLLRLPPQGATSLQVVLEQEARQEHWIRFFGTHRWKTTLSDQGCLEERVGPLTFTIQLMVQAGALQWMVVGCRIGRWVLPKRLVPKARAKEYEEDGVFHMDVEIAYPKIGCLLRYKGWLKPRLGNQEKDEAL